MIPFISISSIAATAIALLSIVLGFLKFMKQEFLNITYKFNWFNLNSVYIKNKFVIKDCFSYSIKNIARQLYKEKVIDTNWENEEISGLDAIILANYAENECKIKNLRKIKNLNSMNKIIKYNEIDCKMLWKLFF